MARAHLNPKYALVVRVVITLFVHAQQAKLLETICVQSVHWVRIIVNLNETFECEFFLFCFNFSFFRAVPYTFLCRDHGECVGGAYCDSGVCVCPNSTLLVDGICQSPVASSPISPPVVGVKSKATTKRSCKRLLFDFLFC